MPCIVPAFVDPHVHLIHLVPAMPGGLIFRIAVHAKNSPVAWRWLIAINLTVG